VSIPVRPASERKSVNPILKGVKNLYVVWGLGKVAVVVVMEGFLIFFEVSLAWKKCA
jgi:hypothetical protein